MHQPHCRWAILGAGSIAREMADALNRAGVGVYGIANRTRARAESLAAAYHIPHVYPDISALFADSAVEVVYIATTHDNHYEWILEALRRGKHVLCEKAITVNAAQFAEALARKNGLVLAEAMTIFHMPLYRRLRGILNSGALGSVRSVYAPLAITAPRDPDNRFYNPALAGGALFDLGVYAISFARLFFDAQPSAIHTAVRLAETGVDEQSSTLMQNSLGQMAMVSIDLSAEQPAQAIVTCERGFIEVEGYLRADRARVSYPGGRVETVEDGRSADALVYEALDMEAAVRGEENRMHLPLTGDVQALMTEICRQWGVAYPFE